MTIRAGVDEPDACRAMCVFWTAVAIGMWRASVVGRKSPVAGRDARCRPRSDGVMADRHGMTGDSCRRGPEQSLCPLGAEPPRPCLNISSVARKHQSSPVPAQRYRRPGTEALADFHRDSLTVGTGSRRFSQVGQCFPQRRSCPKGNPLGVCALGASPHAPLRTCGRGGRAAKSSMASRHCQRHSHASPEMHAPRGSHGGEQVHDTLYNAAGEDPSLPVPCPPRPALCADHRQFRRCPPGSPGTGAHAGGRRPRAGVAGSRADLRTASARIFSCAAAAAGPGGGAGAPAHLRSA